MGFMTLEEGIRLRDSRYWGLLRVMPQAQEKYIELVGESRPWIECYYPRYEKKVRPHGAGRVRVELRAVFPGYLFVRVRKRDIYDIVNLPVRAYWVRFGGNVELIPDKVVEKIKEMEENKELVREVKYVDPFRRGTSVTVHLPYSDVLAIVVKAKGNRIVVDSSLCRCVVPRHVLEVVEKNHCT